MRWVLLLLLAGCVSQMQFRGATQADMAACRVEARKACYECDQMGAIPARNLLLNQYNDCMMSKGYTPEEE